MASRNPTFSEKEIQRRSLLAKKQAPSRKRDSHGHFISDSSQSIFRTSQKQTWPLLALLAGIIAVALFSFQLGRLSTLDKDLSATRLGILRISTQTNPPKYLLLDRSGRVLTLIIPSGLDVSLYRNRRVLVSGTLNELSGTLRVSSGNDIEPAPAVPSETATSK